MMSTTAERTAETASSLAPQAAPPLSEEATSTALAPPSAATTTTSLPKVASTTSLQRLPSDMSDATTTSGLASTVGGSHHHNHAPPSTQIISWSETLTSPTLAQFSPAEPQSHHGGAVQLAIERAKLLQKTQKRMIAFLNETAHRYDTTASALIKVSAGGSGEAWTSWIAALQRLATTLRTTTVQPWHTYHVTYVESITGLAQRYQQARHNAATLRQRALQAKARYLKRQSTVGGTSTANTTATASANPMSPEKSSATALKTRYQRLVKYENAAVKQCQRLEQMALETLQTMEEDRLALFSRGMVQTYEALQQACSAGGTVAAGTVPKDDAAVLSEPPPIDFKLCLPPTSLQTSKQASIDEVGGQAAMDAETLGLPVSMGVLRDKVRAQYHTIRRPRLQATKEWSVFLEQMAKVVSKLVHSTATTATGSGNGGNKGENDLPVLMGSCEGAHMLGLWDILSSVTEQEATVKARLAQDLRALRASLIDPLVAKSERTFKTATEADDASWKQLLEAARAQAKAESRYRQWTADSAKARERLDSHGGIGAATTGNATSETASSTAAAGSSSSIKMGQHLGMGLAKMFELMPATENAMKILPTGTRASLAQRNVVEADQREAKGRQHWDASIEVTNLALEAYQSNAEGLMAGFAQEEEAGWKVLQETARQFVELLRTSQTMQLENIAQKQSNLQQLCDEVFDDMNEWRIKAQQDLVSKCVEKDNGTASPTTGYQLEVHLEPPPSLPMHVSDSNETDDGSNSVLDVSSHGFDEDEGLDDAENREEDDTIGEMDDALGKGVEENQMQKLFRRTLSAPPNMRGIRGKLGRGRFRTGSDHEDFETELFLTYFWPELVDAKKVTTIVDSFSCSFRDGSQQLPFQYGRVYLTPNRVIFTSWTKKKLNLFWQDVTHIKPSKGFHGLKNDTVHVLCRKPDTGESSCMTLGGFCDRKSVLSVVETIREQSKVRFEEQATAAEKSVDVKSTSPDRPAEEKDRPAENDEPSSELPIPPDETLTKTAVVVSKVLHNISVQKYYDVVWAEKDKPLFEPWLAQSAFDIEVDPWREEKCVGTWCKEEYTMTREARFKVQRKTHLYIGPPIANVVQTHRVRLEGSDRCVASMTVCFEGIPYSDSFAVEVRVVATRQGEDLKYECGLAVDFRKSLFLKRQIQAGTIEESTPIYTNFYRIVKEACIEAQGGEVEPTEMEEVEEELVVTEKTTPAFPTSIEELQNNPLMVGAICFLVLSIIVRQLFASSATPDALPDVTNAQFEMDLIVGRLDKLEDQITRLQTSMDEIVRLLQEQG